MDLDWSGSMDEKIKCTHCGGLELVPCDISIEGWGVGERVTGSVSNASTYFCKKCRHVEFFLSATEIQAIAAREKKEADLREQVRQYEQKRAALQKEFEDLQRVISDENQTVKAVNDAKQKIMGIENELRSLRNPDNSHRPWERV